MASRRKKRTLQSQKVEVEKACLSSARPIIKIRSSLEQQPHVKTITHLDILYLLLPPPRHEILAWFDYRIVYAAATSRIRCIKCSAM